MIEPKISPAIPPRARLGLSGAGAMSYYASTASFVLILIGTGQKFYAHTEYNFMLVKAFAQLCSWKCRQRVS